MFQTQQEKAFWESAADHALRLASLSRDPRLKAAGILSQPIARLAVTIAGKAEEQAVRGLRSAEDAARWFLNQL